MTDDPKKRARTASPLLSTVEAIFLETPRQQLATGDLPDPSSPAAASAAGGGGSTDPGMYIARCAWWCACRRRWGGSGGAGAAFGGGGLLLCRRGSAELRRRSAALALLAAPRSSREGIPFTGVRETADPVVDIEVADAEGRGGAAVLLAGWRCPVGTEERRLPSRLGRPPSPRSWRFGGGFRRRSGLPEDDDARVQKDLVVISFVFWTFL